jgi:acyl dehydratase
MLYLEDLNIGDRFISRDYEITLEEVKQFASQYDPQPFHLDEQAAEQHPIFQGLAASGWHTSAITMRLCTK